MAQYDTQYIFLLRPEGGLDFTVGGLQDTPSSLSSGADEYFTNGEIISQYADEFSSFVETYIGQYGDGIIVKSTYQEDGGLADTEYRLYRNTDYSNRFIEGNGSDKLACFLEGTRVSTPSGPRRVETLTSADRLLTADGRAIPVKWVGRQSVATLFVRSDEQAPICIDAGALGHNLPAYDLRLTADHALLLDGVLVQAGALVNGTTIRKMTRAETGPRYTVWHIETEGHELILAEGCAAETFVDNVSRRRFDNYAEYETLFGGEAETILEMDLPRAMSARQLPDSIRALIEVRRAA